MGQKVNPVGMRIGINKNWNTRWYANDKDYATNETFRPGNYLYERVGNYKYTTILGDIRSVPAYRATNILYSSINPKFYL